MPSDDPPELEPYVRAPMRPSLASWMLGGILVFAILVGGFLLIAFLGVDDY